MALRILVGVGIVVYLIYGATHWSIGPGQPPLIPTHQGTTPLVVPSRPQPSVPSRFPGLDHLDDAWVQGPCGHWHGVIINNTPEEPCHMV